jgi:hypothetical protein
MHPDFRRRAEKRAARSGSTYHLTAAGEALRPVISALGSWGYAWTEGMLTKQDYDPALLMWDVRRRVDPRALPSTDRTLVKFEFAGAPPRKRRWWLLFEHGEADLCASRPGYEVDLEVRSHVKLMIDVWIGRASLGGALGSGAIELAGSRPLVRSFRRWFRLSGFAS